MAILKNQNNQNDKDEGEQGSDGQSGQIAFRDFIGTGGETRDDLLSPEKTRHMLAIHQDLNEAKVRQQKEKRQQYQDVKNGKITLAAFREGLAHAGRQAFYKVFPALADKAQFSGSTDKTVNAIPSQFDAETNQDKRNELTYQPQPQPAPQPRLNQKFNPRPRGPGF